MRWAWGLAVVALWVGARAEALDAWEKWWWDVARSTAGIPYRYGGQDPRTGMDCSAFVRYLYAHLGYSLPRTSREQYAASIPIREWRVGALLFFSEGGRQIDHVGIYIGRGYMLHASGKWGRVVVEPVARYRSMLVAIGWPRALAQPAAHRGKGP